MRTCLNSRPFARFTVPTFTASTRAPSYSLSRTAGTPARRRAALTAVRSSTNTALRTYFDPPLLRAQIELDRSARPPHVDYVQWHGVHVFVA